ncbi:BTB/POZ domain-containing protein 1 [Exophiala dermatitidis]
MSHNLWRYLLEDDVDKFRQYLASATFTSGPSKASGGGQTGGTGLKIGSPGSLAASPKTPLKARKSLGNATGSTTPGRGAGLVLTRAEMNTKDAFGRSLLHHAVSSRSEEALSFVKALLEMPFVDLYAQDVESGWTPLHRALYFGNISIAHALMARDIQLATDYTATTQRAHAGGLVKIKDHEGNSPFEVFGLTIAPRSIQEDPSTLPSGLGDNDSNNGVDYNEEEQGNHKAKGHLPPLVDLVGDEVYAFGSNKNLSLGVGDGDDRQFPERLHFKRPDHLLRRLLDDHLASRQKTLVNEELALNTASMSRGDIPAIIRYRPILIQNVVMSKLHTAVLTDDPISNLHMCGFGRGGRLGTGDENTSFTFQCIQTGGLAKRRVSSIALGQDHTVAVCSQGEVYTWGSNLYGQLGYSLPEVPPNEIPMQLTPRQLYGYIKKELVIGAAASAIHSAIYTSSALYTFGKNDGQLGLMDADARSLEIQVLPRRVGVSVLQSPIQSVSATDRATVVLLENHEVIVFTHYGWTKVLFPLETFTNYYMSDMLPTRYNMEANYIKHITSGGNTICALSSYGEVFSIEVPKVSENVPSNTSTTNPTKARNALPPPARLWSIRKAHMAAVDVAAGQNGSIILCTASGSVWRKEKRANIKSVREANTGTTRAKDYKFVRIPNMTGAIAVRSNAFGAFMAVRKDCTVTRDQIVPDAPSLWADVRSLLPFATYGTTETDTTEEVEPARISRAIIRTPSAEEDILNICKQYEPLAQTQYDLWVTSNLTDVRLPIHSFLLKARSRVMRSALAEFQETYYFSIPDVVSIEYGQDGQIQVQFLGADFLTLINLVFYLYTDNVIDVWHYTSKALHLAPRYRAVRIELMKIATHLELQQLERAVRTMVDPTLSLTNDMELAILDSNFFSDADVLIELADGVELPAHSVLLCVRCPFFEGLFVGRAGGLWMSSRRNVAEDTSEAVRVDLKHIDERIFSMVLRHLYADTGEEIFDDVVSDSLDAFIDIVIELMSAANELMLDRLAQICQQTLGKFVNVRNVCSLLNTVAECSVDSFKRAALEYICLNLESMLEMRLLDELDEDLLAELDEVVQANQLAYLPFSRSERAETELFEKHPELFDDVEAGRQRRIDSMKLRSRLVEDEERHAATIKFRTGSLERQASSPLIPRSPLPTPLADSPASTPSPSPAILANDGGDELQFDMDDEHPDLLPGPAAQVQESVAAPRSRPSDAGSYRARSIPRADLEISPRSTGARPIIPDVPVQSTREFERKAVWQTPRISGAKTDLKGIMEQASSSGVSSLTQAMRTASMASKTAPKVSQKERKRQQQQMRQQEAKNSESAKAENKAPSSPWQTIPKSPKPSSSPVVPAQSFGSTTSKQETPKQPLSERQAMAGGTSSRKPGIPPGNSSPASLPAGITPPTSKPAAPQIQSVRHTPLPSRTPSGIDARTSMAEILAQQQIEKIAVKEAVAKRSLQEIQQEQEFQEWWDNESRRVQEEEAQAANAPATATAPARRGGKGGRGGRGGHRRGSGKAKATATIGSETAKAGAERAITTTASPLDPGQRIGHNASASGRSSRGGDGRGRGRGQHRGPRHHQ